MPVRGPDSHPDRRRERGGPTTGLVSALRPHAPLPERPGDVAASPLPTRMLARLLRLLDGALSWLERTSWGAPVISVIGGIILAVVYWITDRPVVDTIVFVSVAVAAWFYILRWGVPVLVRHRAPNLIIEIPHSFEVPVPGGERSVSFSIRIVNGSRMRRVSLHFVYTEDVTGPPRYIFHTRNIGHDLTTNLAPEEETSGTMQVEHSRHSKEAAVGEHRKELIVGDRLSNRRVTVTIPGGFRR